MKRFAAIALIAGLTGLGATPAVAGQKVVGTPGPHAGNAAKAKAYGKYCRSQSRRHVRGQKGTPFSNCVTAMAKVARNDSLSPRRACNTLSRKHAKGTRGTPYSRCVVAAARLKKNVEAEEAPVS